jgi:hypothetical protein
MSISLVTVSSLLKAFSLMVHPKLIQTLFSTSLCKWSHSSYVRRRQSRPGFRGPKLGAVCHSEILLAGCSYNSCENPIWLPGRSMNLLKPRLPYLSDGLLNLPVSANPVIRYPLFWVSFNPPHWLFKAMSAWALNTDGYLQCSDTGEYGG